MSKTKDMKVEPGVPLAERNNVTLYFSDDIIPTEFDAMLFFMTVNTFEPFEHIRR